MLSHSTRDQRYKPHILADTKLLNSIRIPSWTVRIGAAAVALTILGLNTHTAWAAPVLHEAPEGSEWIMADWMFLSFLIFAGASFIAFLVALKSGLLGNIEDAKYYILEIDEPDYYTPAWAKTGDDK